MKIIFEVQNLKCGGCASTIRTELMKLQGIDDVCVNPETGMVTLSVDQDFDRIETIDELKSIGYPLVGRSNSLGTKTKSMVSCVTGRLKPQ